MRSNSLFIGIFGTLAAFVAAYNVEVLGTNISITNQEDDSLIATETSIPKKKQLLGTYIAKNDKNTKLILKNDGTYSLTIDVCEDHLLLTGKYELRDTNLILHNTSKYHEDLDGNEELSFTILDEHTIVSNEKLVCTIQETLFEK